MTTKAIPVSQYKSLRKGEIYIFEHYRYPKDRPAEAFLTKGRLLHVSTRLKRNIDKTNKVTSTELVSNLVGWEPVDEEDMFTILPSGEKLRKYSTHVCCGMFRILGTV